MMCGINFEEIEYTLFLSSRKSDSFIFKYLKCIHYKYDCVDSKRNDKTLTCVNMKISLVVSTLDFFEICKIQKNEI